VCRKDGIFHRSVDYPAKEPTIYTASPQFTTTYMGIILKPAGPIYQASNSPNAIYTVI
jgi:hypothetical protein